MLTIIHFNKKNPYWTDDLSVNEAYVMNTINYVYDRLESRGYLYVSDVCKMLGGELGWDDYNSRFTSSMRPRFSYQRFPETNEIKIMICY